MINNFNIILNCAIKQAENYHLDTEAAEKGFGRIYPFTTENISGYINLFNLKDKSLLTVGSSGDQAINAILNDCKDITILDINPYTKFYYFLKIACILELEIPELLHFLRYKDYPKVFKDNDDVFNIQTFNKIKPTLRLLNYESYLFLDELFQSYPLDEIRLNLFEQDEYNTKIITKCNPYLQSNLLYSETKEKIKNVEITFINGDIFKTELNQTYDNIWLSNIGTHISLHELKTIVDKITNYLNVNGKLLISYLYETTKDTKYQNNWQEIYNLEKTYDIFEEYNLELKTFTGITNFQANIDSNWRNDSVLIYTKKRV